MVCHENGKVVMQFASPTAWIGLHRTGHGHCADVDYPCPQSRDRRRLYAPTVTPNAIVSGAPADAKEKCDAVARPLTYGLAGPPDEGTAATDKPMTIIFIWARGLARC